MTCNFFIGLVVQKGSNSKKQVQNNRPSVGRLGWQEEEKVSKKYKDHQPLFHDDEEDNIDETMIEPVTYE